MVERLIARSLSIETIESQILKFCSGDISQQNMLVEFQRSPRAFSTCMDIIDRHSNQISDKSLPLILFCAQTLVECDHIYSLCRLISIDKIDSKNLLNIDNERAKTINELERSINLVDQLNKNNPLIFPSLRFLLRTWLRLKLFDNWYKRISLDVMHYVNIFKSNRPFQVEILSILAQELCNDRFILNISQRNDFAKECISQAPIVFKFLGVNDLSIACVYSDWIHLHVKYLDSLVDDEHSELPSDVDLMVKSSLSTFISLKLIDRLFEQSPLPIHTITNLINLCPLGIRPSLQQEAVDQVNPLVKRILTLITQNLSKLYKLQSPLFKTTSPILLSLSYEQLPFLIDYYYTRDVAYILDGAMAILSDFNYSEVMITFWINLKRNVNSEGINKISPYLQKIVVLVLETPLFFNESRADFSQIYAFRDNASSLVVEVASAIGSKFILDKIESKLTDFNENQDSAAEKENVAVIESILFILSTISTCNAENITLTALELLNKLKYPNHGPLSLMLSISIAKLIIHSSEYIGKRPELFDALFTLIYGVLLPLIMRIKNNSATRDYLFGENALMDALLALSRTSRKIIEDNIEVRKYLIFLHNIIKNVQFSIENRIKSVNSAGAIISYMPLAEMKSLFSELIEFLSVSIKTSSNPNDYIQLYLMAIQSVRPIPDCIESETTILKIVEKHTNVIELLFNSSNEKILERLSQVLVVLNIISRNHTESFTIFHWTLKLLASSYKSSHPYYLYSALRSILFNSVDLSIDNWIAISNCLLPSLAILKDSIICCCTSTSDMNSLEQMNNINMDYNNLQILNTPDCVGLCIECIDISLGHSDLAGLLLARSEFIIFIESLLVVLPYVIHPSVLNACILLIKSIVSIDDDSLYANKLRFLNIISQRFSKTTEEFYTIAFKIVQSILATVVGGTSGVENCIKISADVISALLNEKTAEDAKNAINSFFNVISDPIISQNVINDCKGKLISSNGVIHGLVQLEGWKLWKRRNDQ